LFNLLPMGPLDGGRMFKVVCDKYFKKDLAHKIWKYVGLFLFALILFNIFAGFFL